MTNEAAAVLCAASDAAQVTVVSPMAKVDADAGVHVTGTAPETRSCADGAKLAPTPLGPVASRVMPVGTPSNTGGVVSTTVTVKLPCAWLCEASVAVHKTVVSPSANVL